MTNSNPKSLLKLYKYNNLHFSLTNLNTPFPQPQNVKPEVSPLEIELSENSPRQNNIPAETPSKEEKHPNDEEFAEDIPFEEVMPDDTPQRKNVPEETPNNETAR